jgi:hypothetical protein
MGEERAFGTPSPEQLAKINKLAKRNLKENEVFVFSHKMAGDMIIPERNVKLMKELLDVFALNAQKGVSRLLDHSWHADGFWGMGGRPKAAISYGRTFDSSFGPATEDGETISLNAETYMKRGVEIDGVSTDSIIQSIEAGTMFDDSIGFNYGKALCSVCGNNYNDSEKCQHYAGKTYEVEGEDGVIRPVLAYIQAYPPGSLWEVSSVFSGAYPGAGVLSSADDVLENEHGIYQVITDLKDTDPSKPIIATYSPRVGLLTMVKKANHKKAFALGGLIENAKASITDRDSIFAIGDKIGVSREQVKNIANLVLKGDESKVNKEILEMLSKLGIVFDEGKAYSIEEVKTLIEAWGKKTQEEMNAAKAAATPLAGVSDVPAFMTKEQATEKLGKELSVDDVLKLAVEGQAYHQKVTDDAIAMGVRAMGNDFPADTWKSTFSTMGTQAISDIAKTWETQAKAVIPGGRVTDPAAGQGTESKAEIPDEAYKMK